jgi:succinoglycan biosynthesis transport protein ExoP
MTSIVGHHDLERLKTRAEGLSAPRGLLMDNTVELRWVVAVIRRWWWLIVFCTLFSASLASVLTSRMPPVYHSTATILVRPALGMGADQYSAFRVSEQLALTYSQMLRGQPVMEAVIARLGLGETPHALAEKVTVDPIEGTQLIRITAETTEPKQAALIADGVAHAFIAYVQVLQAERYAGFLSSVQEQMGEISTVMDETQSKIDGLSTPRTGQEEAELTQLETILAGYRSTYAMLVQNYTQMRLTATQSAETVVITEGAQVPEGPVQRRVLYTTVASVVGAMVAAGGAFVLEQLDDTVRTRDDVRHILGLSTLGTIMRFTQDDEKLVMLARPDSPVAEAFRVLASNVWFSMLDTSLRAILVTSPGAEEGKSVVAANLAVAMAQLGLRVVVLDADLRRSEMGRLFGLDSYHQGFVAALLGEGSVDHLLQPTEVERLAVLGAGYSVTRQTRLLGSERVQAVLDGLAEQADVILIDSPPVLPVADTALLARSVDGLLLVLEAGRTRREAVQRTMECLQYAKASLVGVVLNAVPARWYTGHYSYYEQGGDEESMRGRPSRREHRDGSRGYGLRGGLPRVILARMPKLGGGWPRVILARMPKLGGGWPRVILARMPKLGDELIGYGSRLLTRLLSNGDTPGEMEARNAARRDLPAIARARSLARLKEQVVLETEESEAYSSHELDDLVGQRLAAIADWTVSGRMVRRYLSLLSLPMKVQELAEATGLREIQLRPLVGLDAPEEQFILVTRIAREDLAGAEVERLVRLLRYKKAVVK